MANIALTDDHVLLRNGLANLVKNLGHTVIFEADNGKDFIEKLNPDFLPDIVLMDINMPIMDGCETAKWIKEHHPQIMVLALSMYNDENSVIRMLKCGAKGYLLKDSKPQELDAAINALLKEGFHYSELLNGKLIHAINKMGDENGDLNVLIHLNEKETEFLKYACTELTYKEIAEKLFVSPRTVDSYRDALFEKLKLKTRVGLVMYAVKNGIVRF
jgi:two-component system, NarL family, invasion response regulator UvrY